jgi:hypothetical protein
MFLNGFFNHCAVFYIQQLLYREGFKNWEMPRRRLKCSGCSTSAEPIFESRAVYITSQTMKAVTIDNLDIKDHLRWAQDQTILDSTYVAEAALVAPHPESLGLSTIYASKFDELFELYNRNQHWALFSPPKNYFLFRKRFFSYRLFSTIHWEEEEDSEDTKPTCDLIRAVNRLKKPSPHTHILFEKDKDSVLNLLESIQAINKLLKQVNARKLQYQKG